MKRNLIFWGFILFGILWPGCEKDKPDYRDSYTSNFDFEIVKKFWLITGYGEYDTTFYNGYIEKDKTTDDRITIHFGESVWGRSISDSDTFLFTDYPNPILNIDGTLSYPEYPIGSNTWFKGFFISTDSLYLRMSYGAQGGGTIRNVYGHRVN